MELKVQLLGRPGDEVIRATDGKAATAWHGVPLSLVMSGGAAGASAIKILSERGGDLLLSKAGPVISAGVDATLSLTAAEMRIGSGEWPAKRWLVITVGGEVALAGVLAVYDASHEAAGTLPVAPMVAATAAEVAALDGRLDALEAAGSGGAWLGTAPSGFADTVGNVGDRFYAAGKLWLKVPVGWVWWRVNNE